MNVPPVVTHSKKIIQKYFLTRTYIMFSKKIVITTHHSVAYSGGRPPPPLTSRGYPQTRWEDFNDLIKKKKKLISFPTPIRIPYTPIHNTTVIAEKERAIS